ncbi:MAG: cell division protein FtsZ [Campylobacteraceae bacterium]|jgi:cell division protein FtsZ|nr:cell division protein FtsZ [Campylobacteraceae bacterium]
MNDLFQVEELKTKAGAKIKVIGVGGGGCNMINHMISENVGGIELVVANTDAQALDGSLAPTKIQLGAKLTRGLGAGMKPEVGRSAAEESYQEIKSTLEGADMVFVAAGLGGGTGTGAAEVVAAAAKEVGALTVAVVTKPFIFEGQKRRKFADEGLVGIKKVCDSIVVIPNDKLLAIVDKNMGIKDSFRIVDNVLSRAVTGISGVILKHGDNDINLDFADLKTVMSHKGTALMGVGEASGNDAAYQAMKNAIESPLFDNISISGAMGVLVHVNMHPNYPLVQIQQAMSIVYESADQDADVIFGTTTDENLDIDRVVITIVATGFEKEAANSYAIKQADKEAVAQEKVQVRNIRKISGGYDITFDEDELQVPTYLRRQMD